MYKEPLSKIIERFAGESMRVGTHYYEWRAMAEELERRVRELEAENNVAYSQMAVIADYVDTWGWG